MSFVEQAQKRPWHLYKIDTKALIYFILSSHIHACAGFEFHDNFLIIDRDFLNHPSNQLLIVFSDVLCLLCEKLLHFTDSLLHAFTLCPLHLGIMLCLTKPIKSYRKSLFEKSLSTVCPGTSFTITLYLR